MAKLTKQKYLKWPKKVLIAAIKARCGEIMAPKQDKKVYINRLEELDRKPPGVFRFMDLPAEMRNNIYEELLIKRDHKNQLVAYPAILRTCKVIHKEAAAMLNAESHVVLEVAYERRRLDIPSTTLWYPAAGARHRVVLREFHPRNKSVIQRLHCVQNVTLSLYYDYAMRTRKYAADDVIKFLGKFPGIFKDLRTLKLVLYDSRRLRFIGREKVVELLTPLKALLKEGKVTLQGVEQVTHDELLK